MGFEISCFSITPFPRSLAKALKRETVRDLSLSLSNSHRTRSERVENASRCCFDTARASLGELVKVELELRKRKKIANSEQLVWKFIYFFPSNYISKRNAVKNYQKKKKIILLEFILPFARTVYTYIYIYIHARLYLSQHSFNDLNLFRRAISRHGTKQNKTKQKRNTQKHWPSISPLCFR